MKNNNISVLPINRNVASCTSGFLYYSDSTNVDGASDKSECYYPHLSPDVALEIENREIASLTLFVRNDVVKRVLPGCPAD
ncbi:MAG: hypothetical protein GX811_12490 [Lentisphaerae bacterium]|nr:hypothetical protein [Lentisphaerota bacterium]